MANENTHRSTRLLSADELAARWGVPKSQVWRLAREGRFPTGVVVELGRYRRFRLAGIERFEEAGGTNKEAA